MNTNSVLEVLRKNPLVTAGAAACAGVGIYFLRKYIAGGVNTHRPDLTGKLAVITGGNTGIGYETAKALALLKAEVIVTVKSDDKGVEAVKKLRRETGNYRIDYILLDLASFNSIHNFVNEFRKRGQNIDFLINNAGVFQLIAPRKLTEDGFELQFGVNHLGHFLLTNLLLKDNLIADGARVVVLSSGAHYDGKINFDDLNGAQKFSGFESYSQSKLANVLFARELDRRLKEQGKNITAVSCHPGIVVTNMFVGHHIPWYSSLLVSPIAYPLSKSVKQGAQTSLYCALALDVTNHGGEYFSDCKVKKPSDAALDGNLAKKLWEVSEQLTKLV
jgi:NAD(P)-dependent dehydrogenase (short-subunit alcohol dehydrogenase family)